jgi:hypothetical protein
MSTLRNINTAAVLASALGGCAQKPGNSIATPPAKR